MKYKAWVAKAADGALASDGTRVAACTVASACRGSHHLCPQVQPTIFGHRGGFATHIRSHWAWAIPIPEKLNFADAGPSCAHCWSGLPPTGTEASGRTSCGA